MDGGDRAGYLLVGNAADADLITDTMGVTTTKWPEGWYRFEVISTEVQLSGITAPGMTGSSLIDSFTTYVRGAVFSCSKITSIGISVKSSNTAVIAHKRILK